MSNLSQWHPYHNPLSFPGDLDRQARFAWLYGEDPTFPTTTSLERELADLRRRVAPLRRELTRRGVQ